MVNEKKKSRRKVLLIIIAVLAVVLVAGSFYAGNYLVNFAIVRSDASKDVSPEAIVTEESQNAIKDNLMIVNAVKDEWFSSASLETVGITSDDGLNLVGNLFHLPEESHKWLLAIHGYGSSSSGMYDIAAFYGVNGYNVLVPDMRSHGESEGTYIGMGWLDRLDVLKWIDYIIELDPKAEIILHGVSMGGATVMMVSGEELPENVKGIVEDCGYTSVWDIFSDELSYLFHLPDFPFLYTANLIANIRAGYDFKEASAVKQVANSAVPILFIHGSADTFVHTEMVYEVYDACTSPKDILIVEGAGHAEAYCVDMKLYFSTVFEFLAEKCGMENNIIIL